MLYRTAITIPASTTKASPTQVYLSLGKGTITRWWIGFPPGCLGRVNIAIYRHEHRILPESAGESLYWDGFIFSIDEEFEMVEAPYEVRIDGWNSDTTYSHTVFVGVEVEEIPIETTESLLRRLLHAFVGE